MKLLTLVLSTSLFATAAFAANDCKNPAHAPPFGAKWKECKNSDRMGSQVEQFLLTTDGDLYAYIPETYAKICQIADHVKDFKASAHPNDAAIAYFSSFGDLSYVKTERATHGGNCPKANKAVLMQSVKEFSVVGNTQTTIVNIALSNGGRLNAWANSGSPVYTDNNVVDVEMNKCYGATGKLMTSFVMFSLDRAGNITKVKGKGAAYIADAVDNNGGRGFNSIAQFKAARRVCVSTLPAHH